MPLSYQDCYFGKAFNHTLNMHPYMNSATTTHSYMCTRLVTTTATTRLAKMKAPTVIKMSRYTAPRTWLPHCCVCVYMCARERDVHEKGGGEESRGGEGKGGRGGERRRGEGRGEEGRGGVSEYTCKYEESGLCYL